MKRTEASGDDPFDFFVCLRCNLAMRDRRSRTKP
jgi:hypothetical protein